MARGIKSKVATNFETFDSNSPLHQAISNSFSGGGELGGTDLSWQPAREHSYIGSQAGGGKPKPKTVQPSTHKKVPSLGAFIDEFSRVNFFYGLFGMIMATSKFANIGKTGKLIGATSLYGGIAVDLVGVGNYIKNPNSKNAISPEKARTDVIFKLAGEFAPPLAISYNFSDLFYPGGAQGWLADWHHVLFPHESYPTHWDYMKKDSN